MTEVIQRKVEAQVSVCPPSKGYTKYSIVSVPQGSPTLLYHGPWKLVQSAWYGAGSHDAYCYGIAAGDGNIYKCTLRLPLPGESACPEVSYEIVGAMATSANGEDYRDFTTDIEFDNFFSVVDGKIYSMKEGESAWTLLADLTEGALIPKVSIASTGLHSTYTATPDFYLAAAATYAGATITDHCKLLMIGPGHTPVEDTWWGFLPKVSGKPNMTAVYGYDGTLEDGGQTGSGTPGIFIYIDDWSQQRPVYVRWSDYGVWSAAQLILPTDGLGEESLFSVGKASVYDGRVFLTGTLKRQYGKTYGIQMRGPDKFTFGRELIISDDVTEPLQICSGYDCWRGYAIGNLTVYGLEGNSYFFGFEQNGVSVDGNSLTLDLSANAADRLTMNISTQVLVDNPDVIVPGAVVYLVTYVNGQTAQFSRVYSIDRVLRGRDGNDDQTTLDMSSYAMKRLLDWESDTYFDYLGQAEVHGDPGDLTKLVHISGSSFDRPDTGGLIMQSLNDEGILYTTPAASHGGFIRCKFADVQTYNTMVGVGLNYAEETLAECAARLNRKIEEVKASDRARFGLFAIYYPDPKGKADPEIWLADYNSIRNQSWVDGCSGSNYSAVYPWRVIKSVTATRPQVGGILELAMQYQDGRARVFYANSDATDLPMIIDVEALYEKDPGAIEHENYGRGAIYLRNNTGFHMAFPTTSDCDVIPLHRTEEKWSVSGIPLEDRVEKFPATNGTVVIDTEKITYEGLAGWSGNNASKITCPLNWTPGEVIANCGDGTSDPGGTLLTFAQDRGSRDVVPHTHGNNYLCQEIFPEDGKTISAVRIWLKNVNFPEDNVLLTIGTGNAANGTNLGNVVNTVLATGILGPGSKQSEAGGWVTFFLDTDVSVDYSTLAGGDSYWIVLKRSRNWNHPSSYSYFQAKKMTSGCSGNSAYLFCEEDDAVVPVSGDIAFVVYGKVDGPAHEYCIPVKYVAGKGLPTTDDGTYWAGCATVITAGEGINNCYRVIRSKRFTNASNDLYLFFVDRNPGNIFDIGTQVRAVPAFYGLKRGQLSTIATAHMANRYVHMPASSYARATYFEYFTAEEDLALAEVAQRIARKAGINVFSTCNANSGMVYKDNGGQIGYQLSSPNFVLPFRAISETEQANTGVSVTLSSEKAVNGVPVTTNHASVSIRPSSVGAARLYLQTGGQLLSLTLHEKFIGNYRISYVDGKLSVWQDGRIIGALTGPMPEDADHYDLFAEILEVGDVMYPYFPQANSRVDNFSMDMGKTGMQLFQNLIGEKRVYFRESDWQSIKMHVYRNGDENSPVLEERYPTIYNKAVSVSIENTDIGYASRVLLEGAEVVEVGSMDQVRAHGNIFKTFNFNEINNLMDAKYFARLTLDDMILNRWHITVTGAVDWTILPTDVVLLQLPTVDGLGYVNVPMIVDHISHSFHIDETDVVYDMRLDGRVTYWSNTWLP